MQVLVAASRNPEAAKSSTPDTTMHLWFLYYLLIFSLIAAVGSRWTLLKFDWLFQRKWMLAISPLALVPGVMGGFPLPHPSHSCPSGGHLSVTDCSIGLAGSCLVTRCCWIGCNHCVGLKFCADSSYWVYLIHLPIILFLQTLLIPIPLPVVGKLVLMILSTWLFCLATYVVFVRYTPIGCMLNGKWPFPKKRSLL